MIRRHRAQFAAVLLLINDGRASSRVPVHEVARGQQARATRAQVLLVDCFLRDSPHRFKLEHVVDELRSVSNHEGGSWKRPSKLRGEALLGLQVVVISLIFCKTGGTALVFQVSRAYILV